MELLLLLRTENAKNVSATVGKKVLLTANATVIFHSPIVISAGILPATVIIMAKICTCLLIRKVTYRYFLIFPVLPSMIPIAFCMLFSG